MAETSTIFGFMKYVSATDILSDFKKTVDSHFVNSLRCIHYEYIYLLFRFPMPINCKILKKIFKKSKYNCKAMKMAILSCATTEPSD